MEQHMQREYEFLDELKNQLADKSRDVERDIIDFIVVVRNIASNDTPTPVGATIQHQLNDLTDKFNRTTGEYQLVLATVTGTRSKHRSNDCILNIINSSNEYMTSILRLGRAMDDDGIVLENNPMQAPQDIALPFPAAPIIPVMPVILAGDVLAVRLNTLIQQIRELHGILNHKLLIVQNHCNVATIHRNSIATRLRAIG